MFTKKSQPRRQIPVFHADVRQGLSSEQVRLRREANWHNAAPKGAGRTEPEIILKNTLTFFNLVFAVLAVLLLLGGSSILNCTFLGVVLCNTVIGIVQEIRAKRAVDKLALVASKPVPAVRDGTITELSPEELVRDDIVLFSSGDPICADAVVREGTLQVNESLITGEADAVEKGVGSALKSGSFVVGGSARAQLTNVGADAYAAKLSAAAKADPRAAKSGMMRSLDQLIRAAGILLIPVGLLLFYQQYTLLQLGLRQSMEGTVAALVGMIPEGLYLLTSIAMAASALKLAKNRVLVQDMNCIETLARVDVLCVDKTGTITQADMAVERIVPLADTPPERIAQILAAMYYGRQPDNDTHRAMAAYFGRETGWVCKKYIPFTSETKWSGAVFEKEGAYLAGAPEFILGSRYETLRKTVQSWAQEGYRVLLTAQCSCEPHPGTLDPDTVTPLALVLLSGRIRPEAPQTLSYFSRQGVSVRVISGDNPATASRVAVRAGIAGADRYIDLHASDDDMDDSRAVQKYRVFGRVTPHRKKKLIEALQAAGHAVAMTGDGVNDILAMKQADCSIAMRSGAQAASQVASMVLLNSDFSAMPGILDEGRRVINNIQRTAALFLVKNIFSLGLSLISLISGFAYPLEPFQLTIVSSLTIGIPGFLLALEPNYARVTERFLPGVLRRALPGGLTDLVMVFAAQIASRFLHIPLHQLGPVCAAVLGLVGLLVLFQACRPFDRFRKVVWGSMAAGMLLCFTALGQPFGLHPGSMNALGLMLALLAAAPVVFFGIQRLLRVIPGR